MGTLHEEVWSFMVSHSVLLRIRNVSEKTLSKKSKHIKVASVYWQAETEWITAIYNIWWCI